MPSPPLGRLSTRQGVPNDDDVLHEGVPEHLRGLLHKWTMQYLGLRDSDSSVELSGRTEFLEALAARYRITVRWDQDPLLVIVNLMYERPEEYLEVVDGHLQTMKSGSSLLDSYLTLGGSTWEVVEEPLPHLERRVSAEQRALYAVATTPADDAAEQLRVAWAKAYGRDPDPSDAWDHAIKAVEVALKPAVAPLAGQTRGGVMLSNLRAKPSKWTFVLPTASKTQTSVETVIGMLDLLYPNPDRHPDGARVPTQAEAEAAVGLAVLLVSWLRDGALQRDPAVS